MAGREVGDQACDEAGLKAEAVDDWCASAERCIQSHTNQPRHGAQLGLTRGCSRARLKFHFLPLQMGSDRAGGCLTVQRRYVA